MPHQTYQSTVSKKPLTERIRGNNNHSQANNATTARCRNCNLLGHRTDDCKWLGQIKCRECGWFGHMGRDCRRKGKGIKRKWNDNRGEKTKKRKNEQTHEAEEKNEENSQGNATYSSIEEIAFVIDNDDTEDFNYDTYNPSDVYANDERLSYYDWLADTATTSHITNSRDLLVNYQPINQTTVSGVGNTKVSAKGRGTVQLKSVINGQKYTLKLEDVLYIPTNKHNLISLGRWCKGNCRMALAKTSRRS